MVIFEFDDDIVRDVKDIQAAILIKEVLETLEIEFERIIITQNNNGFSIKGLSDEELKEWR